MIADGGSALPLRVAAACRAATVQAWQQRCLDRLFGVESGVDERAAGTDAQWIALIDTGEAARLYPRPAPLFTARSQRLAPLDVGTHRPIVLDARDVERVRALDLDVIVCFDEAIPRDLAPFARGGLWFFRFGEEHRTYEPPCFWECLAGEAVAEARLLSLGRDGIVRVLRRGAVAVIATSLAASVDRLLTQAAAWPAYERDALSRGIDRPEPDVAPSIALSTTGRRAGVLAAAALSVRIVARRIARVFGVFFADKWNVGIAHCGIERFLVDGARPRVEWLPEPGGLDYRADPFGTALGNGAWALVERYDGGSARGRIEAFPIDHGRWSGPCVDAMTASAHMSYPFLLADAGSVYCIPETLGQRAVVLYRALELPARWERVATLVDGFDAVDATLVRHEGRWWLFCTDLGDPHHHRLHAFFADEIAGPYAAHAANPVKVDPRSAGCAGTPFVAGGTLYRPAQDCSRSYGGRTVINKVVELTPGAFREETAAVVTPWPDYPAGVHTLSSLGDVTLVDGKRRTPTMRRVLWRLSRPFRRLRKRAD